MSDPVILLAVIAAVAPILTAIGYIVRPRIDKRNGRNSNPGNLAQVVRDECKDIKTMLGDRFDKLDRRTEDGFKNVVEAIRRIERQGPPAP
jgi:hypothetical protein